MKFGLISDLHAFNSTSWKGDGSPSHFDVAPGRSESQCPIGSLKTLIVNDRLNVDYLLCPGDLCNNACPDSLSRAWQSIQQIGQDLKARKILTTAGNHDVDSRRLHNTYDPVEALKKLTPQYPVDDRGLANQFWSEHFFVYEEGAFRCLVVNSSAYHTSDNEVLHGRVADVTLQRIREELSTKREHCINILLCHHNPQKHSEIQLGEHDEIMGGQLLIDLIADTSLNDWLIVHGHKHHPKITYASGGANSPIVFSAGSVASTLYPKLRGHTGNQFYIIDIDYTHLLEHGLVGTFSSWDWHPGFGWQKSGQNKGLPANGGFGHRENHFALAKRIRDWLEGVDNNHSFNGEVYQSFPEVRFVSPADLQSLVQALEVHSIICLISSDGLISEISKI